jgi:uncharacterized protein
VKELLAMLARELVDDPSLVNVTEWTEGDMTHLDLEVAPGDRGRVIGRRGQTADALRAVLEAVGRRRGTPCDVEILD